MTQSDDYCVGASGMSNVSVMWAFCCSWVLIAFGLSVGGVDFQPGWLWGLTLTTMHKLYCGSWPDEVKFTPAWSGARWNLPLGVPLAELVGLCSDVVWRFPQDSADSGHRSWEDLWHRSMSCAACDQPWATFLELQKDPEFVVASSKPGSTWKRPNCVPRPAATHAKPRGRSTKVTRHPRICLCLPAVQPTPESAFQTGLHIGPRLTTASRLFARCKIGTVGTQGVRRVGLVHLL